jgi:hypothetical protein
MPFGRVCCVIKDSLLTAGLIGSRALRYDWSVSFLQHFADGDQQATDPCQRTFPQPNPCGSDLPHAPIALGLLQHIVLASLDHRYYGHVLKHLALLLVVDMCLIR